MQIAGVWVGWWGGTRQCREQGATQESSVYGHVCSGVLRTPYRCKRKAAEDAGAMGGEIAAAGIRSDTAVGRHTREQRDMVVT